MYTPEELLQFTPNQATFNFNILHEKLFRLSVPRTSCYGRLSIQIKKTPADPQAPLKVVNSNQQ
jgi:hypothetical protein